MTDSAAARRRPLRASVMLMCALAIAVLWAPVHGAAPIAYRLSFPSPEHHWMLVEATFPDLESTPLELRMSRSSPGRYSLHDFAKNVYDVEVTDPAGHALIASQPDPYGWTVTEHGPAVNVRYRVFGDRVDGTYLGIDTSHAHINMPSAIMWARGLDDRPVTITFVEPAGARWQVASQLHPASEPLQFTAPNLQYLMDSPAEFGSVSLRQFNVGGRTFRFSAHHTGNAAELDGFVNDVEKIVRVEGAIFGEYPAYEPGSYTFLADYLPYTDGDGMEHRNSTVMTSSGSIGGSRADLLDTVAHEFFHSWNAERIRPRSLEPFDFERANMSGELWLAEGFTQYYGPIALSRAGLADLSATTETFTWLIQYVARPGRSIRSAEDMSRMAPFTDGGKTIDRTNWPDTYISYYPFGGAIALGLDLSLRERSNNRVSLDDFMRAMWRDYGKPGGVREGYVDRPYTLADVERTLAEVSDEAFAHDFFARFIHGRDEPDFATLLKPAGLVVRKTSPGRAWWGDVSLEQRGGVRLSAAPLSDTPAYKAGLDLGDQITAINGVRVTSADQLRAILHERIPGQSVTVEFIDRTGSARTSPMTLVEDPHIEVVPVEATGETLASSQRAFRQAWLLPQ